MADTEKCFIMLCTQKTEKECLDRKLFGDLEWRLQFLKEIRAGDIGILLNIDSDELLGPFRARSEPQLHIERTAWGTRFPAQVRVEPLGRLQRLGNATDVLRKIGIRLTPLPSGRPAPQFPVHDAAVTEKLLAHFREPVAGKRPARENGDARPALSTKVTFDDVVGLTQVKQFIIRRMVDPLKDLETAQRYYLRLGGGLLLYGPPGTGKTLVAQATAGEIDAQFIELSPSIIRGYPGEPEKKIEELFQVLLAAPRAVLFLDEAEALLASRESPTSSVMQRVTPVLLTQFARLARNRFKPVLVIAATNMPWAIDNAFLRPGRLDRSVYVGLPDKTERAELLRLLLRRRAEDCLDQAVLEDGDLCQLAAELDGYSAADIEQIADEAAHQAFEHRKCIASELLRTVASDWPRSVNDDQLKRYQDWGKRHGAIS